MKYVIVFVLLTLSGCSSLTGSKKVATEHGLFTYYFSGEEKPTIIFESGLGDDMTSWKSVINLMPPSAAVFAYNRAGFSGSKSINVERNGAVIVSELRAVLNKLNLSPPYVLVGHSLGGGYMELYAKTYPEEVTGIVLVDPNSSKYPEHCRAAKLDFCEPPSSIPAWTSVFLPSAVEGEIKGFAQTHSQINAINEFPNIPTVVLSAANSRASKSSKQKKANRLYTQMHREIAQMSSNSKFAICETCSHYIHQDKPHMVVEAVQWVIEQ